MKLLSCGFSCTVTGSRASTRNCGLNALGLNKGKLVSIHSYADSSCKLKHETAPSEALQGITELQFAAHGTGFEFTVA